MNDCVYVCMYVSNVFWVCTFVAARTDIQQSRFFDDTKGPNIQSVDAKAATRRESLQLPEPHWFQAQERAARPENFSAIHGAAAECVEDAATQTYSVRRQRTASPLEGIG